mgnify:CR=1 FL=1
MSDDPEYIGVTTDEDGEIALSLFYEDDKVVHIYLANNDVIGLIAALIAASKDPEGLCQTYH